MCKANLDSLPNCGSPGATFRVLDSEILEGGLKIFLLRNALGIQHAGSLCSNYSRLGSKIIYK